MKGMYHSALPKGWTTSLLSDIAEVVGGLAKGKRHNPNELLRGVPYLRVANVQRGHLNLSEVKEIDATESEIRQLSLRPGDVLFNEGGDRDKLGRGWIWEGQLPVCLHQNHVFRARPGKGVLSKYLSIYGNHVGQAYFLNSAKQTTNLASISKSQLSALPVWLPPLAEQHRIVAKLDALQGHSDAAKAALDAIGPLLEKFRQSVLAAAFRGDLTRKWREEHPDVEPASVLLERIRAERRRKWEEANPRKKYVEPEPVDTGGLPELPVGWCWASVEEVAAVESGQTPKDIETRACLGDGTPWFRIGDMNLPGNEREMRSASIRLPPEVVSDLGLHVRPAGTIIFPKRGGAIATNKKRLLLEPAAYDLNIMGIFPPSDCADWMWYWFQGIDLAKLSDGSSIPQINHVDIKPLPVPFAPEEEAEHVMRLVRSGLAWLDSCSFPVKAANSMLGKLNQSILAKAFRCELVPQNPNDEPASVLLERIRREREGVAVVAGKRGRPRTTS